MINIKPKGINTKINDTDIEDGTLKESINLQYRDGTFKPLPNRLLSGVDVEGRSGIILHKVSDEDQINVLGFNEIQSNWLAIDIAEDLGGAAANNGNLEWFGTIIDGVYAAKGTPVVLPMVKTDNMTYTILNGMLYFMGNGLSDEERYYKRLQYNENTEAYELKDMYMWKTLIPFYPVQSAIEVTGPKKAFQTLTQCGLVLTRFALVLKSGEVVMHTPIYGSFIYGLNRKDTAIVKGDLIENIHTFINLDLEFNNPTLYEDEISAINVYCSIPYYETTIPEYEVLGDPSVQSIFAVNSETIKGEFQKLAESSFYLVKTIDKATDEKLLLTVGQFDADLTPDLSDGYSRVDISTIAAGEVMPADDSSYHYLYGRISSYNGRIVVDSTKTVLSGGHIRALALDTTSCNIGFEIETEDGGLSGLGYRSDKALRFQTGPNKTLCRGLLSYPDFQTNNIGANTALDDDMRFYKSRKNNFHNMSCAFNFLSASFDAAGISLPATPVDTVKISTSYNIYVVYGEEDETIAVNDDLLNIAYFSENRVQFSQAGEFSAWPSSNSYRIGEGKIMKVGTNTINPRNADVITPLLVGTSDGVYTINADPTGNNLVSNITRIAKYPYISEETLQIDEITLFVSDKGLMAIKNDDPVNLTAPYFPDQGDGDFPDNNSVYPNYNTLTTNFFGVGGNIYELDDIITYMKGALLSYDSRRETVWCSNPNYNFSLLFSTKDNIWGMSTTVFGESIELYGNIVNGGSSYYSWFLLRENTYTQNDLLIISGEDLDTEVETHFFTRPIKLKNPDSYKKISRLYSRCELYRGTSNAYFSFGVWGKQDLNKKKINIPINAYLENNASAFPNDVRQDIPVGTAKGKYKAISILQAGKMLPDSSINGLEIHASLVDTDKIR